MYSKFDVGYRMINEKATVKPQFKPTSLEDEYTVMQTTYVNTPPGTTSMVTPIAKSTLMTQALQMPTIPTVSSQIRDILEPSLNERARVAYLDRQIQGMSSVRLPSSMASLEDGILVGPESLSGRIQDYCWEKRDNRKYEWETHRLTLERMKESKEKQYQQQSQEERDAVYARMFHNLERTRAAIRNSIGKSSTILEEEHQLTLTKDDFLVIK